MLKIKKYYDQTIYIENGYDSRDDYFQELADEYGIDINIVYALSEMLSESESFDGLVSACEDAERMLQDD